MNEETQIDSVYILMRQYPQVFKKRSILEMVINAHDHPERKQHPYTTNSTNVVSVYTLIADYLQFDAYYQRVK